MPVNSANENRFSGQNVIVVVDVVVVVDVLVDVLVLVHVLMVVVGLSHTHQKLTG